jgi:glycosyltransferase involved in cell wall biosynthesis
MKDIPFLLQQFPPGKAPVRVAVVTETYPPEINGVAMTIGRMVDGLLELGHQVQLIRPRQHKADRPGEQDSPEEVLSRGMPIPGYPELKLGLPAKQALRRLWSARRPDIVHIVTEGPLGWSAVAAARQLRLPVSSDFHTNFHHYSRHYGVGWLHKPISGYLRRFHNRTDATLVPTLSLRDGLLQEGYKAVHVVARGVDTRLFNPQRRSAALRAQWGANDNDPVAIYVGRLAPEKNLPLVLRAFEAMKANAPETRLVLVGDGPARPALQARYPQHVFAGMRTGDDLAAHYASADIFLFPSLTETFGNVTAEAMASGLAVVAYDYAAAAQLILDGENGRVAPFDNAGAFVEASCHLVEYPLLRAAMRLRARESVERLDWNNIVGDFAGVLGRIAAAHDRRAASHDAIILSPD